MTHNQFSNKILSNNRTINIWDIALLCLIFGAISIVVWNIAQVSAPYHVGDPIKISLSPYYLPGYAIRSTFRLLIGLCCSLLFTFIVGTLAAKNKAAERIIIPAIDIMQSVPPLGFLSLAVVSFVTLFPHSLLGPECASIFTVFTAQVWNITLSFYQSLRSIPHELCEASAIFQLSAWKRFWRLEVPLATPGLLWNIMLSMSASWFFVVASEAITVANQNIMLPGIGSYIALAIDSSNLHAIFYAIAAMFIVILIYDQLLFRPILTWAEKFKFSDSDDDIPNRSWLFKLLQRTKFFKYLLSNTRRFFTSLLNILFISSPPILPSKLTYALPQRFHRPIRTIGYCLLFASLLLFAWRLFLFLNHASHLSEIRHIFYLGLLTAARVISLIILSTIVWLPIGVWIGMRPKWVAWVQPSTQFLAAFPANLLFPLVTILISRYQLNQEIWTSPLMILGTQWYIFFNVIAGVRYLPKDLYQTTALFQVKRWLWWRRLLLPAIAPYLITGAMAASGGAWNASIIAESVSWGGTRLQVTGLGAYISEFAHRGDFTKLMIGLCVMCVYVLVINWLIWQPLYRWVARFAGQLR